MPILQAAVFNTKYSGPNATSNDKHLSRGGTLSSPSNRVNSYDPDDGQLSLLKTPIGLVSSLELVDSKACLPILAWLGLALNSTSIFRVEACCHLHLTESILMTLTMANFLY